MSRRPSAVRAGWLLPALLLVLLAAGAPVAARSNPDPGPMMSGPAEPAPQSGPVDPQRYRLGPGDVLGVWIWGPIAQTTRLEVGPDGYVFLPDLGALRIAGLTLAEARQRLVERVLSRYRGVQVEVQLQRMRSFVVYVSGAVRSPGPVVANGFARIPDVLPDSALTAMGSRRNIRLRHADGTESVCDLGRFQRIGGLERLPVLQDGDVIEVPPAVRFVGVWGAVGRPGLLELGPGDSLSTLLELGGGILPSAVRDRALLLRWQGMTRRESVWVALDRLQSGAWNTALEDGDHLYVFGVAEYRPLHQVSLVGQVRRAGSYPIAQGLSRLSDVIRAAGGLQPDADSSAILLMRARPDGEMHRDLEFERLSRLSREQMTTSEYESFRTRLAALVPDFRVDWRSISGGGKGLDPLLQPDDIIRVERVVRAVRVDGQVRRPGLVAFVPGTHWGEYVRAVGGYSARAARSQVRVTRSSSGQTTLARNVDAIAPGDFIWVPERPDISTWQHLKDVLTISAAFATIVIAFRR